MEHPVIYLTEILGDFYDVHQDRIIKRRSATNNVHSVQLAIQPRCKLISGERLTVDQLLDFMDIEKKSPLNLLLNETYHTSIETVSNHPHQFDHNTRILYYCWPQRIHRCIPTERYSEIFEQWWECPSDATHQIVSITYGIELLLIVHLRVERDAIITIDRTLEQLRQTLETNRPTVHNMRKDEKVLFNNIFADSIYIYSNIPNLCKAKSIFEIVQFIDNIGCKNEPSYPLKCTIEPIRTIVGLCLSLYLKWNPSIFQLIQSIESQNMKLNTLIKDLQVSWSHERHEWISEHLHNRLIDVRDRYLNILQRFSSVIDQYEALAVDSRRSIRKIFQIPQSLNNELLTTLNQDIVDIIEVIEPSQKKLGLIEELRELKVEYQKAREHPFIDRSDMMPFEQIPLEDDRNTLILCSSDSLNREQRLDYVDLSYSVVTPDSMIDSTLQETNSPNNSPYASLSSSTTSLYSCPQSPSSINDSLDIPETSSYNSTDDYRQENDHSSQSSPSNNSLNSQLTSSLSFRNDPSIDDPNIPCTPPNDDEKSITTSMTSSPFKQRSIPRYLTPRPIDTINILLLGESGVGKSTFINALANYLTFQSLQQAQHGQPVVLIPVSFMITTGHDFDEHIVTFDHAENVDNERFNNRGESVTQQCQEYTFNVPSDGCARQIRIIDTPGFGDTRGVDQDQINIEHIKTYIRRCGHLDAICFLLKPNESRLNIALRSCFIQFAAILSQVKHSKLIFCFTNARATFYAPGNTAPLLRKMLSDLQMDHLSMKKQNTYCFDNESFRYLVANMNGIEFDNEEQEQYENSWKISVKEAKRLLDYFLPPTSNGVVSSKH